MPTTARKLLENLPTGKQSTLSVLHMLKCAQDNLGPMPMRDSSKAKVLKFEVGGTSAELVIAIEMLIPDLEDFEETKAHAERAVTLDYGFKDASTISITCPSDTRTIVEDRFLQILHLQKAMEKSSGEKVKLHPALNYIRNPIRDKPWYTDKEGNVIHGARNVMLLVGKGEKTTEDVEALSKLMVAVWGASTGKLRQEVLYWLVNKYDMDIPEEAASVLKKEREDGEVTFTRMNATGPSGEEEWVKPEEGSGSSGSADKKRTVKYEPIHRG